MNTGVRDEYDRLASSYDERWRSYISGTLAFLESRLSLTGDERVLDVACGTGELERMLLARHADLDITGVDLSENMLEIAREKLKTRRNATFEQASAEGLPFPNDSFDLVAAANSFHYFDDPVGSLREMSRVLKPEGEVIVLDWCKDFIACRICDMALRLLDPAHKQCYTRRELRRMFHQASLEVADEGVRRVQIVWGLMIATGRKPRPDTL